VSRLYQGLRSAGYAGAMVVSGLPARRITAPPTWPAARETRSRLRIWWPVSYEWAAAEKWVGALRASLAGRVDVASEDIEQPYEGAVLIHVELDGHRHSVAIDYFDRDRLLDQVHERCALIFKMQYRVEGYGSPTVVPGGYVPGRPYLYRYLPSLRRLKDRSAPRFDVYGRFGLSFAPDVRRAAVNLLQTQRRFRYEGSLKTLAYGVYLREAARSRVCIDLPGNGDMCHRLVDYLALGCCVVRPMPWTTLPVPLTDALNIRYVRPDLTDLVDTCAELVGDPAACSAIGRAAREYFDRYLHAEQLADYYLDRCLAVLGRR
jgi:hypothetical protein